MKTTHDLSIDPFRTKIPANIKRFIKYDLSQNRLFNFLYNQYLKQVIQFKEEPSSIPKRVGIEPTNNCNANCIMCPRNKLTRKKGYMGIRLFRRIIKDCKNNQVKEIRLHNFGEPLLHKRILEMLKIAKKNKLKVCFSTNGALLNKKVAKKIIESELDEIFISVDSFEKEKYNKIRSGLNLDTLEKNILNLQYLKKKIGKNRPKIFISHTLINPRDQKIFEKKWKGKTDGIVFAFYHDWAGKNWLKKEKTLIKKWPCPILWKQMYVLWNGDVTFCCKDFNGTTILGNCNKNPLNEIYLNEAYTTLRRYHLQKNFEKIPLCKNCKSLVFY